MAFLNQTARRRFVAGLFIVLFATRAARGGSSQEVSERVDRALRQATQGRYADAIALGRETIVADPSDWRGWYLRALTQRTAPLDELEHAYLDGLELAATRDVFRGLIEYMGVPAEERELLARRLVEIGPGSPVAHALLASSLLSNASFTEARSEARRALELDPGCFIAGRVEILALMTTSGAEGTTRACDLMAQFPYDTFIVSRALDSCRPSADFEERWAQFRVGLHLFRGQLQAVQSLDRLLADPSPVPWPPMVQAAVVAELEAGDPSWWVDAPALLAHLGRDSASLPETVTPFVERLFQAAMASSHDVADDIVEAAALHLASRRLDDRDPIQARDQLRIAAARIPPLRRVRVLTRLAEIECADGLVREARGHAADAFVLSHPFEPYPRDLIQTCGGEPALGDPETRSRALLERVGVHDLLDANGTPRRFDGRGRTPTLLVFWSRHCSWAKQEIAAIRAATEGPSSLAEGRIRVLWVNRDPPAQRREALEQAAQLGLVQAGVCFPVSGNKSGLDDALHVRIVPTLVLLSSDGYAFRELRGFDPAAWPGEWAAMRRSLERQLGISGVAAVPPPTPDASMSSPAEP